MLVPKQFLVPILQYIYIYICVCVCVCVCIYTVMAKNIGTLGKYDQRRLWKLIFIVNPFDLLLKYSQKSNISLDNKNLKWGKYHYEINVFL